MAEGSTGANGNELGNGLGGGSGNGLAGETATVQSTKNTNTSPSLADESTPLLNGGQNGADKKRAPGSETASLAEPSPGDSGEITVIADEIKGTRLILILATVYLGVFLGSVDASIIATLSAPISSEFHSLSLLSWLATAYLIANAACQPLSGRLTDIFGRRAGLVFSNILFSAGNLICGLSQTAPAMITGRVIAGIGGGGLMSISSFVASDLVPLRKRGVIQGVGNIAYGTGNMLGGVFGGFLNDTSQWGWRLAFLVQVPVTIVSAILVFMLVRIPAKVSNKSLVSRIDFTGAALIVSFLVILLLGLNAGGNLVPWTHPLVLTSIPLSFVILVVLVRWESRADQPIVPVRLLFNRTVLAACVTNLASSMVALTNIFYVPLYMQVRGYSTTQAALRLLASPIGIALGSLGSGLIMKRTGKYVVLGVVAMLTLIAGVAVLTTLDEASWSWLPFIAMFLLGGGHGAMLTVTLLACIAAVDHAHQAVVTSATYAFRSVGSTVGITAASAVYQNLLRDGLWARFGDLPGAADEIARIRDDLAELRRLPDGWYDGVMASFMEAFRGVWFTALALSVVSLVSISLMKQHKLHSSLSRQED